MKRIALALFLSLASCASSNDAFLRAKAGGDRAKSAGRYDEAARGYHDAANAAKRPFDRDEGLFLEAETLEEQGHWQEAMAAIDRLIALSPKGDRTARLVFERAFLEIDHGDEANGYKMLETALFQRSGEGSAGRALRKILEHERLKSPNAGLAWLDLHAADLAKSEVEEDATYLRAKELEDLGQLRPARDAYVACAKKHPYPYGSLTDDSWWNASMLDEKLGDPQTAVADLQAMLAPREDSTLGQGSYERPRFSPGQKRIAELYRDVIHDDTRARKEFHRLYSAFPTSNLRIEALFEESALAKKDGDASSACDAARTLTKEFSESRYAGCASALCDGLAIPPKAVPCRDYLKARIAIGGAVPAAAPAPPDDPVP